jgi:hypothetical protein
MHLFFSWKIIVQLVSKNKNNSYGLKKGKNIEWVNLYYFFDFRFSKISMIAPINTPKASPQAIDF